MKGLCPEIRLLWHHRNNLSVDANGVIWRKISSHGSQLQLLVPRPARESLFQAYHASLFGADSYTGPVELPVLLVGNVSRREGLAEIVHNLHKEEIAHRPSSSTG